MAGRIHELEELFDQYNTIFFDDKLMKITLLLKKSATVDGYYEYVTCKRDGDTSGWMPRRDRLSHAAIIINDECYDEDTVEGTLLHEMCHQWQCEVLDRKASHDAIFCSKARRIERATGYELL